MFANATFDGLLVNLMMRVRLVRMKVLGRVLVVRNQMVGGLDAIRKSRTKVFASLVELHSE